MTDSEIYNNSRNNMREPISSGTPTRGIPDNNRSLGLTNLSKEYSFYIGCPYNYEFEENDFSLTLKNIIEKMISTINFASHRSHLTIVIDEKFNKMKLFEIEEDIDECHPLFVEADLCSSLYDNELAKNNYRKISNDVNAMYNLTLRERQYDTVSRSSEENTNEHKFSNMGGTMMVSRSTKPMTVSELKELYLLLTNKDSNNHTLLNYFIECYTSVVNEYNKLLKIHAKIRKVKSAINTLNGYEHETIINNVNKDGNIYCETNTKHEELTTKLNEMLNRITTENSNYLSRLYACTQIISHYEYSVSLLEIMHGGTRLVNPITIAPDYDLNHVSYQNCDRIEYHMIPRIIERLLLDDDETVKISDYISDKTQLYIIAQNNLKTMSSISNIPKNHPLYGLIGISTSVRAKDNLFVNRKKLIDLMRFVSGTQSVYNMMAPIHSNINKIGIIIKILIRCVIEHTKVLNTNIPDSSPSTNELFNSCNDMFELGNSVSIKKSLVTPIIIHTNSEQEENKHENKHENQTTELPIVKPVEALRLNDIINEFNTEFADEAIELLQPLSEEGTSALYKQLSLLYSYVRIDDYLGLIPTFLLQNYPFAINFRAEFNC